MVQEQLHWRQRAPGCSERLLGEPRRGPHAVRGVPAKRGALGAMGRKGPQAAPPLTDALVAIAGGEVQRGPAPVVGRAGVRALLQQTLH